jgi:arylsulfatase K
MKDVVPIPHIRELMSTGANFVNAYANVPICCPSRASVWAGREGHNMPHETNGIKVNGAWNNYEGFSQKKGEGFDTMKISDRLAAQANYTVKLIGKEDWLTGGHSLNTMIDSFSIYSRWPYNVPEEGPSQGGFHIWGDCGGNVSINPGNQTAHAGDWKGVVSGTEWLTKKGPTGAAAAQPFFLYDGTVIVHPPYHTDQVHWDRWATV